MSADLFLLGQLVATPAALDVLTSQGMSPRSLLARHVAGDFGDLEDEDMKANRDAIDHGSRVFSSYDLPAGKVWVITEADRSSTCVLLPSDY